MATTILFGMSRAKERSVEFSTLEGGFAMTSFLLGGFDLVCFGFGPACALFTFLTVYMTYPPVSKG
jgi:hypothetical protein